MTNHYLYKCKKCKKIQQCRCPSETKQEVIIICEDCKKAMPNQENKKECCEKCEGFFPGSCTHFDCPCHTPAEVKEECKCFDGDYKGVFHKNNCPAPAPAMEERFDKLFSFNENALLADFGVSPINIKKFIRQEIAFALTEYRAELVKLEFILNDIKGYSPDGEVGTLVEQGIAIINANKEKK